MERRFFRGLAQGQAEMKKTGSRRASGFETGLGSAVLEAPEESYALEPGQRAPRQGRGGPAPAGALQRGYGKDGYGSEDYDDSGPGNVYGALDEPEYIPRRGKLRFRWGGLPRSVAGRIVSGVVVFGVLGAVAVAIAGVRSYLLHDPRFVLASSDDIQIAGAEHLTRDQVVSVFGADLERNIFRVSLGERQADLERLPWVAHAAVMRLLPDAIRVQITERTPVAFVRQGTQIGLVDAGGVLLDMPPDAAGDPHYSFPVLTGLSAEETVRARAAQMEVYEQFMRELDSAGEHLTDSVSEVDVSDTEDVRALITAGSSDILVHFGQENFLKRYREFEQHLPEWRQDYPKLASADMRYEGQIVLEMQNGAGVATGGLTDAAVAKDAAAPAAMATATATTKAKATATATAKAKAKAKAKATATATARATTTATTTATARATTGVLRFAQDDGEKRTTAAVKPLVAAKPLAAAKATVATNATAAVKPMVTVKPLAKAAVMRANGTSAAKVVAAKQAVGKPVAKKPGAKPWMVAKTKAGSGVNAANQKLFAQLAAAHRAALAKEHKAETVKIAKNGRAGGKSGVTP
jgi:cell division protein FtsQ